MGKKVFNIHDFLFLVLEIMYINFNRLDLAFDFIGLYLSGKDSASNPSRMTQVCVCVI